MSTFTVELPNTLTVDVKDFATQTVSTEKWTGEILKDFVRFSLKVLIERKKNSGGEKATDADKRDAVAKIVKELSDGTFEFRAGAAAALTEKEEIFRKTLAEHFVKKGDCKKTDASNYARVANRLELYRDLVVKRQLMSMGVQKTPEEMLEIAKRHFWTFEQTAENQAEANRKAREEMEISF